MLIDLHTHTFPKSQDSVLEPDTLLRHAKQAGLDGVCLTEHDGFWDPETLEEWSRRYGLLVLPGCEVTTEEGHLLVYGLDRYIFGMHRASFVKGLVDQAGGAMVIAHPYRGRYRRERDAPPDRFQEAVDRASLDPVLAMSRAVETHNGRGSEAQNRFSQALRQRLDAFGTGASDAHSAADVGTFATEFDAPIRDLSDLIRELRAGRYHPTALRIPWAAAASL